MASACKTNIRRLSYLQELSHGALRSAIRRAKAHTLPGIGGLSLKVSTPLLEFPQRLTGSTMQDLQGLFKPDTDKGRFATA